MGLCLYINLIKNNFLLFRPSSENLCYSNFLPSGSGSGSKWSLTWTWILVCIILYADPKHCILLGNSCETVKYTFGQTNSVNFLFTSFPSPVQKWKIWGKNFKNARKLVIIVSKVGSAPWFFTFEQSFSSFSTPEYSL